MDRSFRDKLEEFLLSNTSLSNNEAQVASAFLSALKVTDNKYRLPVLMVMVKAIELIEKIVSNKVLIDESSIDIKYNVLN